MEFRKDFLFLLDLCKSPEEVFPEGSKELQLTRKWLNYLTSYECEHEEEMRIVNLYMSHLCVALVGAKLYGPFTKEPPRGNLDKVDFNAEIPASISSELLITTPERRESPFMPFVASDQLVSSTPVEREDTLMDSGVGYSDQIQNPATHASSNDNKVMHSAAFESQGHITVGSTNLFFNVSTGGAVAPSTCSCPPKPCQCTQNGRICNCHRARAGAEPSLLPHRPTEESICNYLMHDLNLTPDFLRDFDANLTSFIDLFKVGNPKEGKSQEIKSCESLQKFLPHSRQPSREQLADLPSVSTVPDYKEMREDICELMEAISAELRGAAEPGISDYLERELAHYNGFVMSHSDLASHLKSLSSDMKLRYFLLLGLQNDLVKLLIELMSPGEKLP